MADLTKVATDAPRLGILDILVQLRLGLGFSIDIVSPFQSEEFKKFLPFENDQ